MVERRDGDGQALRQAGVGLAGVVLAVALASAGCSRGGGDLELQARLTGEDEVPTKGAPEGSGSATITPKPEENQICYELSVSRLGGPATLAHIHEGQAGQAGNVVVNLQPPGPDGRSKGCTSVAEDEVRRIAARPENFYVNVHTARYQGGAVRGQLHR